MILGVNFFLNLFSFVVVRFVLIFYREFCRFGNNVGIVFLFSICLFI